MKNVVRISKQEIEFAEEFGISSDEWAFFKLQIEREQELKKTLKWRRDQAADDGIYGEALARIEALEEAYDILRDTILSRKRRAARLDVALEQAQDVLNKGWEK